MGTRARPRPARLASKLLEIRTKLGLSQNGMIARLGLAGEIVQADVSAYELDQREPPLHVLLGYARATSTTGRGEFLEALIDDGMELPGALPADPSVTTRQRAASSPKPTSRSRKQSR